MQTTEFLARVLPERGLRVVVAITPKGARQTFHKTNDEAAAQLLKHDAKGTNAYHGCATYLSNKSRKSENAEAARALWVDLDCGDAKPYATQKDAAAAAVLFTKTLGLPPPLIVNSGRGLHVYWLLETEVCPSDWQRAAALLKLAAQHAGFHADPSRTSDIASILRTPGTHNHKAQPLEVRAVRDGSPAPYDYVLGKLEAYCLANDLNPLDTLGAAPAHAKIDNSDLEVKYDGPPPRIDSIVEGCAIIREFRDSGGKIEEPLWRACMGVVRHCEDGAELCHEWSSGHPNYSYNETQSKLDGLDGTGPTTCGVLGAFRPSACSACPFAVDCKSPISIAYRAVLVKEIINPEEPDADPYPVPDFPEHWQWTSKGLFGPTWDKDDSGHQVMTPVKVSSVLFYPIDWITDTNNDRSLRIRVHLTASLVEDFELDCAVIAEGGTKLLGLLGKKMITAEKGKGALMSQYLVSWMNLLRQNRKSLVCYDRYGWFGKDFLLGTTMFKNDGTQQEVVLSGSALTTMENYIPKGALQTWVETVDRGYNHQTLEPLQFAILAGLASPLLDMFNQYGGLTVYMHTQKSGEGKTTIARAALSCYGTWEKNQLTHGQWTVNGLYATFGTVNALPLVLDEMTNIAPEDASLLVHTVSSGTPKVRCEKNGSLQNQDHRWSLFAISSGNNLLTEKINQHRSQAGAENARVFEYSIQGLLTPIPVTEAATLFPLFADHYGHAGREFIKYVTANYDAVKTTLLKTHAALVPVFGIQQSERYWGALLACVITTHKIATKLGLVGFPQAPLISFIHNALNENRLAMAQATPAAEDQLGRLIADLWPGIFITHGQGDVYARWDSYVAKDANGPVTGRYIMRRPGPDGVNDTPVVYLRMSAVRDWCNKHNVSCRDLIREASAKGLVSAKEKRVGLGQGSVKYSGTGSFPCLVVDQSALPVTMSPGVPNLTVVQGSKAAP